MSAPVRTTVRLIETPGGPGRAHVQRPLYVDRDTRQAETALLGRLLLL